MPGSGSSVGSRGSRAYRRVGNGADVDETLFASKDRNSASRLRNDRANATISRSQLAGVRDGARKSTVLSRSALEQMKSRSVIKTAEHIARVQAQREKLNRDKMDKAERRKAKMLKLEEEARKNVRLTREEEDDLVSLNATLARAADQVLEQNDQVKTMRRQMMYAQCAKIREQQIMEKTELRRQKKAFEERQDLLMEIDRLKSLKSAEDAQVKQRTLRMADARVIREQIKENERRKILEDERLEQEKIQMIKSIERQNEDAEVKRKMKMREGKQLLEEVLLANEQAMKQKLDYAQEEKDEDARIFEYQESENRRLARLEAEKEEDQKRKDAEFHLMAKGLKKAQDNRSEMDEMRAKRARQEQEKKDRDRERKTKAARATAISDLAIARKLQADSKIEGLKLMALQDQAEWNKINRENAELQATQDEAALKQKQQNTIHQRELKGQISRNETEKSTFLVRKREEGERLKRENEKFLRKITKKKQAILGEMRAGGIPEKYCAEVAMMQIKL